MSQMVFVRIIVVVDYYVLLLLLFATLVFASFSSRRVCLAFVRCISISQSLISDLSLSLSHQKHLMMMRAQTGRHHGATVGLFLRSLVLDISSFIFDASYTLAARARRSPLHKKRMHLPRDLPSCLTKRTTFRDLIILSLSLTKTTAKKTSKKPTNCSGIPGKVRTTQITSQSRKGKTYTKPLGKPRSY